MKKEDIKKLSELARIGVSDEEMKKLESDIESILDFVGQVQNVKTADAPDERVGTPHNVVREDGTPHAPGRHTKDLLKEAPKKEKGYVKVKNIL